MHQLGKHTAKIAGVEEGDGGAHRAVPRPGIKQPHVFPANFREGRRNVRDRVPDVMYPLTAARDETSDGGVLGERLEELHMRSAGVRGEHRLTHALVNIRFFAHNGEPKYAHVPFDGRLKRPASDSHMIDSQQHARYRCMWLGK